MQFLIKKIFAMCPKLMNLSVMICRVLSRRASKRNLGIPMRSLRYSKNNKVPRYLKNPLEVVLLNWFLR